MGPATKSGRNRQFHTEYRAIWSCCRKAKVAIVNRDQFPRDGKTKSSATLPTAGGKRDEKVFDCLLGQSRPVIRDQNLNEMAVLTGFNMIVRFLDGHPYSGCASDC